MRAVGERGGARIRKWFMWISVLGFISFLFYAFNLPAQPIDKDNSPSSNLRSGGGRRGLDPKLRREIKPRVSL